MHWLSLALKGSGLGRESDGLRKFFPSRRVAFAIMTRRDGRCDVSCLPLSGMDSAPMACGMTLCAVKRPSGHCFRAAVESLRWWRGTLCSQIRDSGALAEYHFVSKKPTFQYILSLFPKNNWMNVGLEVITPSPTGGNRKLGVSDWGACDGGRVGVRGFGEVGRGSSVLLFFPSLFFAHTILYYIFAVSVSY